MSEMENLRRELLYKSTHRGCKETDILLGKYAEARLTTMDHATLNAYQELIEQPDNDIYDWITDKAALPTNLNAKLIYDIKQFHALSLA